MIFFPGKQFYCLKAIRGSECITHNFYFVEILITAGLNDDNTQHLYAAKITRALEIKDTDSLPLQAKFIEIVI